MPRHSRLFIYLFIYLFIRVCHLCNGSSLFGGCDGPEKDRLVWFVQVASWFWTWSSWVVRLTGCLVVHHPGRW